MTRSEIISLTTELPPFETMEKKITVRRIRIAVPMTVASLLTIAVPQITLARIKMANTIVHIRTEPPQACDMVLPNVAVHTEKEIGILQSWITSKMTLTIFEP